LTLDGHWVTARNTDWNGPLLNLEKTRLRGPHNAENMMAALAMALVVKAPLDKVVESLAAYDPAPHRCELVAQIGGVQFINDSKATNVDAVRQALLTIPEGEAKPRNIYLIAGGKDKGFDYDELGPLLERRTAGAFLIGETRDKIFQAWNRFTPCVRVESLLEAVNKAARAAVVGDVVLLSPACSSFDMFQNYQHRGELFRQAVRQWEARGEYGAGDISQMQDERKCDRVIYEGAEPGGRPGTRRE
jgi:UDP-N-acetylmuramoylalanine--D-glutamate ligase